MKKIRNAQLFSAVVFLLTAVAFLFGDSDIQWAWRDNPIVGVILAAVSLVFWGFFAWSVIRIRRAGIQE